MKFAISSIDAETTLPASAGGKAKGLQLIMQAGLNVPEAWALTPVAADQPSVSPPTAFGALRESTYAVRSSAADEDGEAFSFAGIHESQLGITAACLGEAVDEVARSALSDRARAYRDELGLPPPTEPCAVVVQRMIASECAGVAFSVGDRGTQILIEAVQGLGDLAVDGSVRPEALYVKRSGITWRLARRARRDQPVASTVTANGLVRVSLQHHERRSDVVTPELAVEISAGLKRIEERIGKPVDVEWAWADGVLWFLQARPRTRPLTENLPPGETWTRANARDVLPEIPSAYCRDVCRTTLNEGVREYLLACGVHTDESQPLFYTIFGRPVFNERVWGPGDLLGIPRQTMQVDFGGVDEADDSIAEVDWSKLLSHPLLLFRSARAALTAPRRAYELLELCQRTRQELEAINLSSEPSKDLLRTIRLHSDILGRATVRNAMAVAAAVSNASYMVLTQLRKHPQPRALVARLLADGEATVSTQQLEALTEIADSMRAQNAVDEFATKIEPEHALRSYWETRLPFDLWSRINDWLERYGHRGPYESDLASPRYGEDLRLLAEVLFPLVRSETNTASAARRELRRAELSRAWDQIECTYGSRRRRAVERRLAQLKRVLRLRELVRSEAVRATQPIRAMVLELGKRLVSAERLSDQAHVWDLTLPQLERAFEQQSYSVDVAVSRELSKKAAWRRISVPNRVSSDDAASLPESSLEPVNMSDESMLKGNGISPGVAEGAVCILSSPSEGCQLKAGAILVAPATDPGWTPLFARAAAVIVEIGGALSHTGIVAREIGIPCVANIDGLVDTLNDGDVVTVDGNAGTVNVVTRSM